MGDQQSSESPSEASKPVGSDASSEARSSTEASDSTSQKSGGADSNDASWLSDVNETTLDLPPIAAQPKPVRESTIPVSDRTAGGTSPLRRAGYASASLLAGSGAVLLLSTLPARKALRESVVTASVSNDEALSEMSMINRRVTIGYGCLAMGAGLAGSTAAFLSSENSMPMLSFSGAW